MISQFSTLLPKHVSVLFSRNSQPEAPEDYIECYDGGSDKDWDWDCH